MQHTRIAVALARGNFLLVISQKTIENLHVPKRQLYAYAANDSTLTQMFARANLTVDMILRGFGLDLDPAQAATGCELCWS